jgi:hypothetical protein
LIAVPSEKENQFALGFSLSRWVLIVFVLVFFFISTYFLFITFFKKGLYLKILKLFESPSNELSIGSFILAILMAGLFVFSFTNIVANQLILVRIRPVTQMLFLIAGGNTLYHIIFLRINPVIKILAYLEIIEKRLPWLNQFLIYFLIVMISLFYLINMQDGHDWGGDFSMYIMNANNIVKGIPYAQTGYIYNPDMASNGPPVYPPVFPLLLSPFIAIWGINLQILKLPGIIFFIGLLIYLNVKIIPKEFPLVFKMIILICIGLYVNFFLTMESINSDIPFLLFCYIALNRINNLLGEGAKKPINIFEHILTGIFIYLAYGTRSVGLILLPVALIFSFLKNRKISLSIVISLLVPLILIFAQGLLIPQTGSYFDQLPKSLYEMISVLLHSMEYYFQIFLKFFPSDDIVFQTILFVIMIFSFAVGLSSHIRKGISSFDLFFFIYLLLMLVWPSYQSWRLLIPIIPIYFLYIIEGMNQIVGFVKLGWLRKTIPVFLLIGVVALYSHTYSEVFPRPLSNIEKKETQELFEIIRTETNSEDVILFFNPRVMALFTERKSVTMMIPPPNGDTMSRMNELEVSVVVRNRNQEYGIQPALDQYIATHPENFQLIYENMEFQVFRTSNLLTGETN